jgi:hypothetical protein
MRVLLQRVLPAFVAGGVLPWQSVATDAAVAIRIFVSWW